MKHLMTLVAVLAMASFSLGCESDDADAAGGGIACQQYVECCADNMMDLDSSMTFVAADAACQQGVDAVEANEEACAALVTSQCSN